MRNYTLARIQTILQTEYGVTLIKMQKAEIDDIDSFQMVSVAGKIICNKVSLDTIRLFLTKMDYP